MVSSVTNVQKSKNGHDYVYADYYGLSTDSKPTTGVFNGATFLEDDMQGGWAIYIFDADHMAWHKFASWTVE